MHKYLDLFKLEVNDGLLKIDDFLLDEEFKEALVIAHGLKGACLLAGLDDLAKEFNKLEDFLVDEHLGHCVSTLSQIARLTLDIESTEEDHEYNLREILIDQSELVLSLNISYSANINNTVDFDKALALRKIVRELIKNSLSHSNLETKDLEIKINICDSEDKIKFEYLDNGNPKLKTLDSIKNKELLFGRGVGVKSIQKILNTYNSIAQLESSDKGYKCTFSF